jgi:hypothetical protein
LGADGHILSRCHRHSAGNEARNTSNQDILGVRSSCSYSQNETSGRYNSVIRAQHRSTESANPFRPVSFGMSHKKYLSKMTEFRTRPMVVGERLGAAIIATTDHRE